MPRVIAWMMGSAVGVTAYVVGTKAGRARYRDISAGAKRAWNDPAVTRVRERGSQVVEKAAKTAIKRLG